MEKEKGISLLSGWVGVSAGPLLAWMEMYKATSLWYLVKVEKSLFKMFNIYFFHHHVFSLCPLLPPFPPTIITLLSTSMYSLSPFSLFWLIPSPSNLTAPLQPPPELSACSLLMSLSLFCLV